MITSVPRTALFLCLFCALDVSTALAADMQQQQPQRYAPGELIVRFVDDFPASERAARLSLLGVDAVIRIDRNGNGRVRLRKGESVAQALARFASDPAFAHAQPNFIYRAQTIVPDDPRFDQQWALRNEGQTIEAPSYVRNNPPPGAVRDIDAPSAWGLITDCSDVVVAVLDTGINYTHQDLAANMWDGRPHHGHDFVDDDEDPLPTTVNEHHGTHLAGIIGAVGGNGSGITGVCPQASLMVVRVLDQDGAGTTADVVAGIEFAVEHGASVINMSFTQTELDAALSDAIALAQEHDALVVVAAGNQGREIRATAPSFPCSFSHENLICVTALDQAYALADFANRGAAVDLGAPGTNIVSTWGGIVIDDALDTATAWSLGGRWGIDPGCDIVAGQTPVLANPENWCGPSPSYDPRANDRAWRTFPLGRTIAAEMAFSYWTQLAFGDVFSVAAVAGPGDPFAAGETLFQRASSQTGNAVLQVAACADGETCSIGFRLQSTNFLTSFGVGVWNLQLRTMTIGSDAYANRSGTSLAAAHVAGVAALVRAYSPEFSVADTRKALLEGGRHASSLEFTTASGRALDARGALDWIDAPSAPQVKVSR
jgi:thermitase